MKKCFPHPQQGSGSQSSLPLWEHMLLVLSSLPQTCWQWDAFSLLQQCTKIHIHKYKGEQEHFKKTPKHQREKMFLTKCCSIVRWIFLRTKNNRTRNTQIIYSTFITWFSPSCSSSSSRLETDKPSCLRTLLKIPDATSSDDGVKVTL